MITNRCSFYYCQWNLLYAKNRKTKIDKKNYAKNNKIRFGQLLTAFSFLLHHQLSGFICFFLFVFSNKNSKSNLTHNYLLLFCNHIEFRHNNRIVLKNWFLFWFFSSNFDESKNMETKRVNYKLKVIIAE